MEIIFTFALIFGAVFSVQGACDMLDCTIPTSCSGYAAYKTCLETLLPDCTSSAIDLISKPLIEAAISATDALIAGCGGSSTCDMTECPAVATSCSGYAAFKTCLQDLLPHCTSSATDLVNKPLIEAAISATDALIAYCGGSSTCDMTECPAVATSCSGYAAYKTCLQDLLPHCTSSATDLINKPLIEAAISATDAVSAHCGASSASVSMVTLLLAAAAAYFKS